MPIQSDASGLVPKPGVACSDLVTVGILPDLDNAGPLPWVDHPSQCLLCAFPIICPQTSVFLVPCDKVYQELWELWVMRISATGPAAAITVPLSVPTLSSPASHNGFSLFSCRPQSGRRSPGPPCFCRSGRWTWSSLRALSSEGLPEMSTEVLLSQVGVQTACSFP